MENKKEGEGEGERGIRGMHVGFSHTGNWFYSDIVNPQVWLWQVLWAMLVRVPISDS